MNLQEQLNTLRHDNAELRKSLAENTRTNVSLNKTIEKLTSLVETLTITNKQQAELIQELRDEIARLKEMRNKNPPCALKRRGITYRL